MRLPGLEPVDLRPDESHSITMRIVLLPTGALRRKYSQMAYYYGNLSGRTWQSR
jgi:hypothetical protein